MPRGRAGADNSNLLAAFNVHHCEQPLSLRIPQQHKSLFLKRMTRVGYDATEPIAESRRRLFEHDLVLNGVRCGFFRIPVSLAARYYLKAYALVRTGACLSFRGY